MGLQLYSQGLCRVTQGEREPAFPSVCALHWQPLLPQWRGDSEIAGFSCTVSGLV